MKANGLGKNEAPRVARPGGPPSEVPPGLIRGGYKQDTSDRLDGIETLETNSGENARAEAGVFSVATPSAMGTAAPASKDPWGNQSWLQAGFLPAFTPVRK